MAKFLFATLPVSGHVAPGLPIARRLVEAGHEVLWYSGRKFRDRIEATGARFIGMTLAPDFNDKDLDRQFPGRVPLQGLNKLKWDMKHLFIDPVPGQVVDLEAALEGFPADVLVSDTAFLGSLMLMERRGIPAAYYGVLPPTGFSRDVAPFGLALPPDGTPLGKLRNRLLNRLVDKGAFRDVNVYYKRMRARLGLKPSRRGFLDCHRDASLFMQSTVPSFEYPRTDWPSNFHFIGPLLPEATDAVDMPEFWGELSGRTIVHVTQGTIANEDFGQLLRPTLEALAGEDCLVVASTGGKPVASVGLREVPTNARIVEFIPYASFMPHVDVYVTNGGYGGVQFALAHGVPVIGCGTTEDKPEINARIAWAGVGLNLKTSIPSPAQIRVAVRQVLGNPRYAERARAIQAEMAAMDAPGKAAELLEGLAAARNAAVPPLIRLNGVQ